MRSPSEPPEQKQDEQRSVITPGRLIKQVLTPQETTVTSLGEFLIPLLLAAMEACWIDAVFIWLASIDLFGSRDPLIPFWAPFLLIAGPQWLFYYSDRRSARGKGDSGSRPASEEEAPPDRVQQGSPLQTLFVIVVSILALFLAWLHLYANRAFVLDPRWILALLNDILLLNLNFYSVVSIAGVSVLLSWRGIRLSQRDIEPYHIFQELLVGLGVMITVILLQAGQPATGAAFHYDLALLLLIPIFLFLSLAAHALARVSFVRRTHPTGLQGSVVLQERSMIVVIGTLGIVILLITLLVGSIVNPGILMDFLAPLGIIYSWLVGIFATIATIIVTPFFLLATWWFSQHPSKPLTPNVNGRGARQSHPPSITSVSPEVLLAAKIIVPLLILLALYLLLRWALRRQRSRRIGVNRRTTDVHESLWSWSLFWMQLKAFLLGLWLRFFPRRHEQQQQQVSAGEISGEPAARTIREIYRALLKKAAYRGYVRKRDETPYEFRQRLDEKAPVVEPQLETITEAYALTRYGGDVPDQAEVARVRNEWAELDSKWN